MRKIALLGNASTIDWAPYTDQSWEIWAHASTAKEARRVDRFFDLHPPLCFKERKKNGFKDYYGWLKKLRTPIYMQQKYGEIPSSRRYPKERILAEFRGYFAGQTAWMIALALTEGVDVLGFFGIHYQVGSEYFEQRPNCEYWMGYAEARGVKIVMPDGVPLLQQPAELYGYESHTPERFAARKAAKAAAAKAKIDLIKQAPPISLGPLTPINAAEDMPFWKELAWGHGLLGEGPAVERFHGTLHPAEERSDFVTID